MDSLGALADRAQRILHKEGPLSLAKKSVLYPYRMTSRYCYNSYWNVKHSEGTSVLCKDWDNLIILDACRYDDFVEFNSFEQPVEKRVSLGSQTTEFMRRNFLDRQLHDTVYVTASPHVPRLENGEWGDEPIFHDVITLFNEWDEETHTIMPETVRRETIEAQTKYPDKRLIIHFVQPHVPYIGQKAQKLQKEQNISIGGWEFEGRDYTDVDSSIDIERVGFEILTDDSYDISRADFREMYRESLKLALDEVIKLVGELKGKTAITSDHGEVFAEKPYPLSRPIYGHPKGWRTDDLCIVPWVEILSGTRKNITTEEPVRRGDYDEKEIEKQLTALGYR